MYSISNGNLRFTHYEQKLYLKQTTLMTYNNIKKQTPRFVRHDKVWSCIGLELRDTCQCVILMRFFTSGVVGVMENRDGRGIIRWWGWEMEREKENWRRYHLLFFFFCSFNYTHKNKLLINNTKNGSSACSRLSSLNGFPGLSLI